MLRHQQTGFAIGYGALSKKTTTTVVVANGWKTRTEHVALSRALRICHVSASASQALQQRTNVTRRCSDVVIMLGENYATQSNLRNSEIYFLLHK